MKIVASSPDGLEKYLANEISEMGGIDIKTGKRNVSFSCDKNTFYKIHFFSKIAFRFYREIARFSCYDKQSLYDGVQNAFDWLTWLPTDKTFCVNVSGRNSYLRHSHFTALQVKNAIVDIQQQAHGRRSSISLQNPYLIIHLHLNSDHAVLSLQSTSESLHKRGYRPAIGKAPLKENIAAGLIQITKWDGRIPLIDIMCGSGTFLVEAARKALNHPTNNEKKYLFENWIDFDKRKFLFEKSMAKRMTFKSVRLPKIIGCEIDSDVYNQAKENICIAGLDDYITLLNQDFSKLQFESHKGLILCNPPYGKKLGCENDLIDLYSKIGQILKRNFSGWEFWLLSGNPKLTKYLKMKSSLKIPVSNGGIDCRWIKYLIN